MAPVCQPPIQSYAAPAAPDILVGQWRWYPSCNDWFWEGQKRSLTHGWVGDPWSGYHGVAKPTTGPQGQPLGTPGTPAPNPVPTPVAAALTPTAATQTRIRPPSGIVTLTPPSGIHAPPDVYQPEGPQPEEQYPGAGYVPSEGEKETAPPAITRRPPTEEEPPQEEPGTPPAETGPCKKWHVFLGDTKFPVGATPSAQAVAQATGVPLKSLAIVSVDDETCLIQAAERVCSCDLGIDVDTGVYWQSPPANDLSRAVTEAINLRIRKMADRFGSTTIASFGDLYDLNSPKTFRGWNEYTHEPEGEARSGVAINEGGGSGFAYSERAAYNSRDWWLFRTDPEGKRIWYGFAVPFAVVMRFSPVTCRATSNLNQRVPANPAGSRVRPSMRSIYAQWVKPWSVGDFAFDTTSSYDELTIGAADSGRLIREGNTERRCLIFCDSPGLHTRSGTSYRERIDEYVTNILEVRADDDGYSRRAFYDGEQRVITQLNREKTELMIGYPRFYKGCYYTECADPQNPDDLRRFGIACFWAFRPTLYISSIFYDFEPDPAGDSWSAGRIRGFYRKKPIVENGAIPWADPKRYRIRVGGTFWPAGTQSWDPALEAEPERAPGRWPNVFSWTSED